MLLRKLSLYQILLLWLNTILSIIPVFNLFHFRPIIRSIFTFYGTRFCPTLNYLSFCKSLQNRQHFFNFFSCHNHSSNSLSAKTNSF